MLFYCMLEKENVKKKTQTNKTIVKKKTLR